MSEIPGIESSPPPSPNWYYCDDGTTVVGPLSQEAMQALRRCGTITANSRVVAQGSTDWTTYREAFGTMTSTSLTVVCDNFGPAGWSVRIKQIAGTLKRAVDRLIPGDSTNAGVSRKKVAVVVIALVLLIVLGGKIHSKIERERAGREFRERAIAEKRGSGSSAEDYFSAETEKAKRFLNETGDMVGDKYRIPCDRCDGYGQVGYNCDECGGSGVIVRGSGTELACPGCAGRGRVGRTCSKCNGEGKILSDKPY
jgi:hypothetical protein